MELPSYRIPDIKSVWIGLLDRAKIFLKRVGGLSSLYRFCYGSCVLSLNRLKVQLTCD
jgi:Fe2+ transport system protein B